MKLLQPRYFEAFHCIGSTCEDTCCVGWIVNVDKPTYEKYQNCSSAEPASSLHTLITINENRSNDDDYARIALNGTTCPFLSESLCSIQQRLGEEYLPKMCATYPRNRNSVDDVFQQSLDLSCPEAARLALLNSAPIEFDEKEYTDGSIRPGYVPALDMSGLTASSEPYRSFRDVQRRVISLLQNRSYPMWKRLFMLGSVCENPAMDLDALNDRIPNGFPPPSVPPAAQLEAVLELIVARIGADSSPRRFLECYREFMSGIEWTTESTMDDIARRYAEAHAQYYVPFMSRHEHILEHYLVNYAFRTLFPFGVPESNHRLCNNRVASPIRAQYMLMAAHYAITRTLLIGTAGFHKSAFGIDHVIKVVQSCTKTFEHSTTYPGQAIEILAEKTMTTPARLCVLFQD